MELTAGCHFTREEADKLQKGLRFRFLESHGLIEGCLITGSIRGKNHLNWLDVIDVE